MIRAVVIIFMLVACIYCQQDSLQPCFSVGDPTLNLQILTKYSTIQTSTPSILPAMVRVTSNGDCKNNLDIVFVVDTRKQLYGSLSLVQQALKQSLNILSSCDRVSIVSFQGTAKIESDFKRVSQANKQYFTNTIDGLVTNGEANIPSGMKLAFQLLRSRKEKNQVTLVALISDGESNKPNPLQQIQNQLSLPQNANLDPFTIDTFVYGYSVNANLLKNIADLKDGTMYQTDDYTKIASLFISAIIECKSIVARQILIKLQIIPSGSFSGIIVSKTYGSKWKFTSPNHYQIKIMHIYQATLDFSFNLTIPSLSGAIGQMGVIASAKMTVSGICSPIVSKEAYLNLKLISPNDPLQGLNPDVMVGSLRSLVVESLNDVYAQANEGNFSEAFQTIDYSINLITSNTEVQQERMALLKNDLLTMRDVLPHYVIVIKIMSLVAINNYGDQKGIAMLSPKQLDSIKMMRNYIRILNIITEYNKYRKRFQVILSSSPSNTIITSPTNQNVVYDFLRNQLYPNPLGDGSLWLWRSPASTIVSQTITFKSQFYSYCSRQAYLFVIAQSDITVSINSQTLNIYGKLKNKNVFLIEQDYLKCGLNAITLAVDNPISSNYSGIVFKVEQDQQACFFGCLGYNTFFNMATCQCECIQGNKCSSLNKLYTWKDYPYCFCICANQLQCPSNQYFNRSTCACQCKPAYCQQKFTLNPTSCNCTCKKITRCNSPQAWNPNTCSCECPSMSMCTANITAWSSSKCRCQCVGKLNCKAATQIWNRDTCECDCKTRNETCLSNMIWNKTVCGCQCLSKPNCTGKQIWNPRTCVCDCKNKLTCLPNQFINTKTCACQCLLVPNCTANVTTFNQKNCACECITRLSCPRLIQKFNATTCECQCMKTEACNSTIQFWNKTTCSCQCHDKLKQFTKRTKMCDCIKKVTCTNATFYAFSSGTCRCECKNTSACSSAAFTRNSTTCFCQCAKKQSDCSPGETFNTSTCACMAGTP